MVTVTPGRTALVLSVTRPSIAPIVALTVCAAARPAIKWPTNTSRTGKIRKRRRVTADLLAEPILLNSNRDTPVPERILIHKDFVEEMVACRGERKASKKQTGARVSPGAGSIIIQPINQSTNQPTNQSVNQSTNQLPDYQITRLPDS